MDYGLDSGLDNRLNKNLTKFWLAGVKSHMKITPTLSAYMTPISKNIANVEVKVLWWILQSLVINGLKHLSLD